MEEEGFAMYQKEAAEAKLADDASKGTGKYVNTSIPRISWTVFSASDHARVRRKTPNPSYNADVHVLVK